MPFIIQKSRQIRQLNNFKQVAVNAVLACIIINNTQQYQTLFKQNWTLRNKTVFY